MVKVTNEENLLQVGDDLGLYNCKAITQPSDESFSFSFPFRFRLGSMFCSQRQAAKTISNNNKGHRSREGNTQEFCLNSTKKNTLVSFSLRTIILIPCESCSLFFTSSS